MGREGGGLGLIATGTLNEAPGSPDDFAPFVTLSLSFSHSQLTNRFKVSNFLHPALLFLHRL
jgi:hypothetical protein